jgi:hypothetical protein
LLHPQITDFIDISRRYFRKSEIILATNGILLPTMPDNFWETCHKNNIIISLSYYPINIDIKKVKDKTDEYSIALRYNKFDNKTSFGHFRMDIEGKQNGKTNIKHCYESTNCHCLDHGRMFICYLPACIGIFNRRFDKHIPVSSNDYLDIYKCKNISEIIRFLKKPTPFCNYCNVKDRACTEWGISKKVIDEWI